MKKSFFYIGIILIQICLLMFLMLKVKSEAFHLYAIMQVIGIFSVVAIAYSKDNPSIKITWIITILILPIFGLLIYAIYGVGRLSQRRLKKMQNIVQSSKGYENNGLSVDLLKGNGIENKYLKQIRYINSQTGRQLHRGANAEYLRSGEEMLDCLIVALEDAKHFIHLEFYIIDLGKMWDKIEKILLQKASNGVEVRVMYDHAASMDFLDEAWHRRLKVGGIKIGIFHKVGIFSDKLSNQRNHRKIVVVDGEIGFTGGVNIGDEYINSKKKLGYWKDSAIMISGSAVSSLSMIFINDWVYVTEEKMDYNKYMIQKQEEDDGGYLQFFEINPGMHGNTARNVVINMINGAGRYLYITTPYLILDQEVITAMCLAARGGVDVRVIVPGTPDHKSVYIVSRSFFDELLECGVKIYLYKPGFMHGKMIVADGQIALLGSINFDFRSFYLNYEVGAILLYNEAVAEVEKDFIHCMNESEMVDANENINRPRWIRLLEMILRLFAPLM